MTGSHTSLAAAIEQALDKAIPTDWTCRSTDEIAAEVARAVEAHAEATRHDIASIARAVVDAVVGDQKFDGHNDGLYFTAELALKRALPSGGIHMPSRDDDVAAWLKAQRDRWPADHGGWHALDDVLDVYREAADTGSPILGYEPYSPAEGS